MAILLPSTSITFITLLYAISSVIAFTPIAVISPAVATFNNGVYFYGGTTMRPNAYAGATTQFFAINVSCSWNTTAPAYVDLSSDIPPGSPPMYKAIAIVIAEKLVIALGFSTPTAPPFIVYAPGSVMGWSPIKPNNSLNDFFFGPRVTDASMATISTGGGMVYIWGGMTVNGPMTNFWVVNTQYNATKISTSKSPPLTLGHVLVSTNDNRLCLIGGITQNTRIGAPMSGIWCFDTVAQQWTSNPTTGENIPGPRINHTAILDGNGNIVMYGGMECSPISSAACILPPAYNLAILNITSFYWITPNLEGGPSTLYGHSAAIVDNQMIVAFGAQVTTPKIPTNDVYILDMSNGSYSWVTQFNPSLSTVPPSNIVLNSTPAPISVSTVAVAVTGTAAGILLLSVGLALKLRYRWRRRKLANLKSNELASPNENEPIYAPNEYTVDVKRLNAIEPANSRQHYEEKKPDSLLDDKADDLFTKFHRALHKPHFRNSCFQSNEDDILMDELQASMTLD